MGYFAYRVWELGLAGILLGLAVFIAERATASRVALRSSVAFGLVTALCLSVSWLAWPLAISLRLCESELLEYITSFRAGSHGPGDNGYWEADETICIFSVSGVKQYDEHTILVKSSPSTVGFGGLVHARDNEPYLYGPIIQKARIAAGWYYVSWE